MKSKILFLFFILISIIIYLFYPKNPPQISFYHWQSSFDLNQSEKTDLKNLSVKSIYVKIFDISYDNTIEYIPTKIVTKTNLNIIPVIYIENNLFIQVKNIDIFIKTLSNKIKSKIKNLNVKKIEFDCDWSLKTKDKYFYFLNTVSKKLNLPLSATIRLHQVKYFQKTGVPPVSEGVLMYYNMSNIKDINNKNYILDNLIAKKYFYNFDKYPLKLNLALPIYSQAVVFRYDEIVELIEGTTEFDLQNKNFQHIKENRYKVVNSHYFKGSFLYKDDIIRFEDSQKNELLKASKELSKIVKNRVKEVIFYRLDSEYIKKIGYQGFRDIAQNL